MRLTARIRTPGEESWSVSSGITGLGIVSLRFWLRLGRSSLELALDVLERVANVELGVQRIDVAPAQRPQFAGPETAQTGHERRRAPMLGHRVHELAQLGRRQVELAFVG